MSESAEDQPFALKPFTLTPPDSKEPEASTPTEPEASTPTHPAATANETLFPLVDAGEYYIGLWSGIPNYGCPYCLFATLDGNGVVELHILAKAEQGDQRHQAALELKGNEGGLA